MSDDPKLIKLRDVKAGDVLRCDHGFVDDDELCLIHGTTYIAKADKDGEIYVDCEEGTHHLLADGDGTLYDFIRADT